MLFSFGLRVGFLIGASLALPGCTGRLLGSIEPGATPAELTAIRASSGLPACFFDAISDSQVCSTCNFADPACRNTFVTMRMYDIDVRFTEYVHELSRTDTSIALAGDVIQLGLTTAATAIPVTQTTKVLAAAATAVGGAKAVYNRDVFLAQSLQIVETQMRTDRDSIKQTILSRLACPATLYPIGLGLADLQAYADAGTVTSALIGVSKQINNAKPTTDKSTGTAKPASTSSTGSADEQDSGAKDHKIKVTDGTITVSYKSELPPCPLKELIVKKVVASR